jgi:membrane protein YqaA with SNARE-associated domain
MSMRQLQRRDRRLAHTSRSDSHEKPEPAYLHSKFGHRKLQAILNFFHKWGTSALAVSTAVPTPMPTGMLFAAAGASDYAVGRFLTVVIICRSARCNSSRSSLMTMDAISSVFCDIRSNIGAGYCCSRR